MLSSWPVLGSDRVPHDPHEAFTAPQVDADAACATPPAGDCDGDHPWCTNQSASGDCSDAIIDALAFCVESEWTCPPGFRFDEDVRCEWPEDEEPANPACGPEAYPPECYDQGPDDCSDTTQPASCIGSTWTCPNGWDFDGNEDECNWEETSGG
jgi:hypothetical protein